MLADPDTLSTLRTSLLQPRPDPPWRASDARVTSANRGTMLRCISYNCETICKLDRLPELCRWARACRAPALLLQGLASGIEQYGDVEGYMIFVSARSGPTRNDGVLVALCMRTFARSVVTAVHDIVKGKALGIRVKGKRGTEELDVYLVSANAPVVQPGDADTVGAAHHTFWQSFERGIRRVSRRSVLIIGIDANGEVGSSRVGTGGERCPGTPHVGRRTENGRELYTKAKDYGWKLQNTFGPRRAEQWTWQHPQGGRHRIDYFCVRLAARATPARPIYEAAVACSGFRDHRPLVMMVPMTAAVKRKRNVQRQLAWDRTKLCDALAAWKDWNARVMRKVKYFVTRLLNQPFSFRMIWCSTSSGN